MSDHQLIQKMGAAILLPKVGEVAYFTDSSGNLKQVDSAGSVTAVGGGGSGTVHTDATLTGDGSVGSPLGTSGWWADAQRFLETSLPKLTEFVPWKAGVSFLGGPTTLVAGNYTDGFTEGGSGLSAAPSPLSKVTVWQAPKTGVVGLVMRAKFPAISANLQQIGLTNNTNGLQIAGTTAIDATHWALRMNNPSETDFVLSVADTSWRDFAFLIDGTAGTPTLTIAIDKVTVGTFTGAQLANYPTTPSFPQSYSADGTLRVSKALWGYVAV